MKAIQAADRGGYDALRLVDIPRPQPRAGQALVRVTSAGVTPLDRTVLAGLHPSARKLPLVPGNEGAGVVIEDPSGRLSACDFSIYGAFDGTVDDISADSITNEKGESFYRVRAVMSQTKLQHGTKECSVMAGMQATVDIVTGKKTVMNYLLKPFVKASETALRER